MNFSRSPTETRIFPLVGPANRVPRFNPRIVTVHMSPDSASRHIMCMHRDYPPLAPPPKEYPRSNWFPTQRPLRPNNCTVQPLKDRLLAQDFEPGNVPGTSKNAFVFLRNSFDNTTKAYYKLYSCFKRAQYKTLRLWFTNPGQSSFG
jgi:hypothetical protein